MSLILSWLGSRASMLALAVALAGAFYSYAWWQGHQSARTQCREEALTAELQESERQRRAAEAALRRLQELLDEQGRDMARLEAEAEAYVAELHTNDACALDDGDVRRLRAIH